MKIQHLLILPVLLILLSSCKKDDPIVEQEDTASYLKATFNYDQEFLDLVELTNVSDSLATLIDIVNDDTDLVTPDNFESQVNYAVFVDNSDGEFDSETLLYVNQVIGTDTLLMFFEIYGDLEAKAYNYASADLFGSIFEGEIDAPDGTLIPYLFSFKSQVSFGIAFAGAIGDIDFSGSTFEITELDEVNNEISGTFTFNWELIGEEDGDDNIPLLKVTDGVFNNLKLLKE